MVSSGYSAAGVPDVGWWFEQLHNAEEFRKFYASQSEWDKWRDFYRGNWKGDVLPVNIFFSMLRSTVPKIYFRNPAVSVTPLLPGAVNLAFAQVVNRMDNKLLREMQAKNEIKAAVQDTFLFGTGFWKIGWSSQSIPVPIPFSTRTENDYVGKGGVRVEYDHTIRPNMPWVRRVSPANMLVPAGIADLREARWIAQLIERPREDVERNPRFKNNKNLIGRRTMRTKESIPSRQNIEMVELFEIRDMKEGKYLIIAPDTDKGGRVLAEGPDPMLAMGFPFIDLRFNPDDEVFWGIPDSRIIEPYQLELNENNTMKMKHRRLAIVKWLAQKGQLDDTAKANLLSEDVAAILETKGNPNSVMTRLQAAAIPDDLFRAEEATLGNVREALGFSRNQAGEFMPGSEKVTAREVDEVASSAEIRVDERRDTVADGIVRTMECINGMAFEFWRGEQVLDVVGPGGVRVWVKFNPSQLKVGRYHLKVDPDSGRPRTRAQREGKALIVYERLKANPLIDPEALTRFVLTELEGVEMDELMRALPAPNGPGAVGSPQRPVPIEGYAGMLRDSVRQLPQRAGGR